MKFIQNDYPRGRPTLSYIRKEGLSMAGLLLAVAALAASASASAADRPTSSAADRSMATAASSLPVSSSPTGSATVTASEVVYIPVEVVRSPPPPPPPLDKVVANWVPLNFLLILTAAWLLVMVAVTFSLRCCAPASAAERRPLYYASRASTAKKQFGTPAWAQVDDSVVVINMGVDAAVRAAFVRKVYAILATQLVATVGVVVGLIYAAFYHGNKDVVTEWGAWILGPGYYLTFVAVIAALLVLCVLMCVRDQFPINIVCLALFTGCMSFEIGVVCVTYYAVGFGSDLLLAFVLTAATFLLLTVFTIVSRIDFSFLGPLLCVGIFVLLFWSFILSICFMFGGYSASWSLAWTIMGMIVFVGFIIYDTYMIVTRLGVDDYVMAAIELYLDMINLFLLILSCLTLTRDR